MNPILAAFVLKDLLGGLGNVVSQAPRTVTAPLADGRGGSRFLVPIGETVSAVTALDQRNFINNLLQGAYGDNINTMEFIEDMREENRRDARDLRTKDVQVAQLAVDQATNPAVATAAATLGKAETDLLNQAINAVLTNTANVRPSLAVGGPI